MKSHIKTGRLGEQLALDYLNNKGYSVLETNYRNKIGEVDIIAYDKDILAFIEVKTRMGTDYGYAYESVNSRKQKKIANTCLMYLQKNKLYDVQVRFDVIEVYPMEKKTINHFENAFSL
ncbi:YraN family protein [Gudongella sp. SC589]|jgi:putative endonuclease|uniref:YraN family protein n=1 Tax=Gudongella sp. SC589 TaxID=3385990 RepID=UPI003904B35D